MIRLKALGGLSLESSPFTRPKPLLLLAYVVLEGPQQRKHLAELFWREGKRMGSLAMTLTHLRKGAGEVIAADAKQVRALITSDVKALLAALDKSDWEEAVTLYTGVFLEGVVLGDWSSELEEWVYTTREYLAERVQYALLNLAEDAAKKQEFETAATFAERAYKLPGLAGTDVNYLKQLYTLLCAGKSLLAPEVRKEAERYGVALHLTTEEARAAFRQETKATNFLPLRGTSFVGRDVELTELATLLNQANVSLLTLLGTAGIGKTRLALQFAHEQQRLGAFKDGVYFVSLESLSDASLIPTYLLSHVGLSQQGKTEPLQQLVDFLAERNVLLILDNVEHVSEGVEFLSQVLSKCPKLKILVTSRETLQLEEEHVFALEGLSFPQTLSGDATLCDAVQLFKERAQQVKSQFELNGQLPDVIRICQLVEGLPLGIELAASWVRLMSCNEIVSEIEKGLELLASTSKNIPERHRSLRAAFDYSWQLLTAREQEVLSNLSVFQGGFLREAAREVAGATIPVLASLVDKSLIRVLSSGRYDFHPLLYQFSQEKLAEQSLTQHLALERHTHYYLQVLEQQIELHRVGKQDMARQMLQAEASNIRELLERSIAERNIAALRAFIFTMYINIDARGTYHEGHTFLARIRSILDETQPEERLLFGLTLLESAWHLYRLGDYSEAEQTVQKGLSYVATEEHKRFQARGLVTLGLLAEQAGQRAKAIAFHEQARAALDGEQDERFKAVVLGNLGSLTNKAGKPNQAKPYYEEAIKIYRAVGAVGDLIRELGNLGVFHFSQKNFLEAETLWQEGLAKAREVDQTRSLPYLLMNLSNVYEVRQDYQTAIDLNLEALQWATETNQKAPRVSILNNLASLSHTNDHDEQALRYSAAAIRLALELKAMPLLMQSLMVRGELYLKRGELEQAVKLLSFVNEHPATISYERQEANNLLTNLRGKLTARLSESIPETGQKVTLEQIIETMIHESSQGTDTALNN